MTTARSYARDSSGTVCCGDLAVCAWDERVERVEDETVSSDERMFRVAPGLGGKS